MSINADSATINFNGSNLKIATTGRGLIFADGTTLSSNTEIGGSSNLQQVSDNGNVTSNTILLTNPTTSLVASGNIESNLVTTIVRFQHGTELPGGQGITLDNAATNGNTISSDVQFSNGLTLTNDSDVSFYAGDIVLSSINPYHGVRIGKDAGKINQYNYSIALGIESGYSNQGSYAIAIGHSAGHVNQSNNSMVLNATGSTLNGNLGSGLYIDPIASSTSTANVMVYNTTTKQVMSTPYQIDQYGPIYCEVSDGPVGDYQQNCTTELTVTNSNFRHRSLGADSHFTVSSGVITVKVGGTYRVSFTSVIGINTSDTSRTITYTYLRVNGTGELRGSKVYLYNRQTGEDEGAANRDMFVELSADDTIELRAGREAGTSSVAVKKWLTNLCLHRINSL